MVALGEHRALTCPGCGGHLPDTTDGDGGDWIHEQPIRCHRCTALADARDRYTASPTPHALHHHVRRRTDG